MRVSEPQNILLPNLVWWWIITSQSVMQNFCFCCCYLQGQGHNEGPCDQNVTISTCTIFSELLVLWQSNLVWWYIIISQSVLWKKLDNFFHGHGHSEGSKCQWISVQMISSEPFTTQLGMVMHHHEPECLSARLVFCLQCQGHSEGSYNQNMTLIYLLKCWSFCN